MSTWSLCTGFPKVLMRPWYMYLYKLLIYTSMQEKQDWIIVKELSNLMTLQITLMKWININNENVMTG